MMRCTCIYLQQFSHIATKEEDENNENGIVEPKALSFLMKDYNYSYPLCACQSMAIYYNHNQAFIGFCAFFSETWVKDWSYSVIT